MLNREHMHYVDILINYLIKEIGALCKLRSQRMLSPVYPEISSEGLGTEGEGQRGRHTYPESGKCLFDSIFK